MFPCRLDIPQVVTGYVFRYPPDIVHHLEESPPEHHFDTLIEFYILLVTVYFGNIALLLLPRSFVPRSPMLPVWKADISPGYDRYMGLML